MFFLHCQVLDFFVKQSELKRTMDPLKIDFWHCLERAEDIQKLLN